MIERVSLVNFKNHADTQIELGRLTALIGPNSSGKTNVLQAVLNANRLLFESVRVIFGGDEGLNVLVRNSQDSIGIELNGEGGATNDVSEIKPWSISVVLKKKVSEGGHKRWMPNITWKWGDQDDGFTDLSDAWSHPIGYRAPREFIQDVGRIRYLKLVGDNLKTPSYRDTTQPRMDSDGSGIATVIAYLMISERERFTKLVESLRSVVPDVRQVRIRPAEILMSESRSVTVDDKRMSFTDERKVVGDELVFDMVGVQEVPASSVSEGTLLALGLLTLLWSPDCPNLVLLDDIEQGLHPRAQRELIAQLRKILEQRPELQIVLTSHSPYIVDELGADEVWLLATDEEGVAQARRLSDHPDAERALEVLTTGEFWSAEGEDWVVADGK